MSEMVFFANNPTGSCTVDFCCDVRHSQSALRIARTSCKEKMPPWPDAEGISIQNQKGIFFLGKMVGVQVGGKQRISDLRVSSIAQSWNGDAF
jgi:hypothetical protein